MDDAKRTAVGRRIQAVWQNLGNGRLYIELARELEGLPASDLIEFIGGVAGAGQPGRDAIWGVLRAALDRQLVTEHVAAQERMSVAAEHLQRAGLALAVATGFMTLVGLYIAVVALKH